MLYTSEYPMNISAIDARGKVFETGLPVIVRNRWVNTSGGMRESTTVTLQGKEIASPDYDKFLDLRYDIGAVNITTKSAKTITVRMDAEESHICYASIRTIHPLV